MLPSVKDVVTDTSVFLPDTPISPIEVRCGVRCRASTVAMVNSLKKPPGSISMSRLVPPICMGTNTRPSSAIVMSRLVRIVSLGQVSAASVRALAQSDNTTTAAASLRIAKPPKPPPSAAPDRRAVAGEAEARPFLGHGADRLVVHADQA